MDFMENSKAVAAFSPDPSTKVGASIVQGDHFVTGMGCNDFSHRVPKEFWNDRALKYKYVIHAEVAAILQAGIANCTNADMYVTHHPCRECARLIGAVGIRKVICPEKPWRDDPAVIESVNDAREILLTCGVQLEYRSE